MTDGVLLYCNDNNLRSMAGNETAKDNEQLPSWLH